MSKFNLIGAWAVCLGVISALPAAASPASLSPEDAEKAFMATLHPVHGKVALPDAKSELDLGTAYYFLDKEDARKVIVGAWGNPPDAATDVLGMIVPEGHSPLTDWGAVVTYEKTDYVPDGDADKEDYDKLIQQMQEGEADNNAARQKAGYPTTHLVGWAQPPSYDKASHTMVWARDVQFSDSKVDALNYDIRILGRYGVLSLNMVAAMPQLATIREQAAQLAGAGHFQTGARYADYKDGDAKAAYGVGGLVAAGLGLAVAKKLGLLAVILVFLKKGFVIVLAALAGIGRWFSGLFGRKPKVERASVIPPPNFDTPPVDDPEVIAPRSSTVEDASSARKNLD